MQEAQGVAGQAIPNVNKLIIPASDIKDPLYQGFEKWQYTHTSLDGSTTVVHYMYNATTKAVDQVKIP